MTVFQSFIEERCLLTANFFKGTWSCATYEVYVFNRVKHLIFCTKSTFLGAVYGIELCKTSSLQLITMRAK